MFSLPPFSGWASSYSVSTRFLWNPCALGHQPIVWWRGKSLQSCSTHCDPIDCSLPGSSVHGIFSGKSSGVGGNFFLQGIFQIQGSHPHLLRLLHWQAGSLPLAPSRTTPSPDGVILKPWMWWINTPFFFLNRDHNSVACFYFKWRNKWSWKQLLFPPPFVFLKWYLNTKNS